MRRRGLALVELLVVVVLLLLITGAYLGLRGKAARGQGAKTIPGRAIEKADSVACRSNLSQIRQMIQMDMMDSERPPPRIDQGATAAISKCPVSGRPYSYNPQTGQVWCTTAGHEKY